MEGRIFISYSRKDLDVVKPIKEELERNGFSCWMDLEGIESGSEEFTENIANAIEQSDALLFFFSANSQKSRWSLNELRVARDCNKHVVLVRFNDDRMINKFKLEFGGAQFVDWRVQERKEKLLGDLRNWLGQGPSMDSDCHVASAVANVLEVGSGKEREDETNGQSDVPVDHSPDGVVVFDDDLLNDDIACSVSSYKATRMSLKTWGCILISCLVVVGGFLFWDASRTVQCFYADYVDSFGLPEGIFPLEKSQLQRRRYHYRFEYHGVQFGRSPHADSAGWNIWKLLGGRRRLVRVVQADSRGRPFIWSIPDDQPAFLYADRPSTQNFLYDRDARLREISCGGYSDMSDVNPQGIRVELSNESTDDGIVTTNGLLQFFSSEGRLVQAFRRSESTSSVIGDASPQRSSIVQNRVFRDARGRVFRCYFLDARGYNVPEGDGLYGFEYAAYDDYGRPQVKWYLVPQDGGTYGRGTNKIGVAGEKVIYSGRNLFQMKFVDSTESPVRGPYGWKVRENRVDEHDNVCSVLYKNENGNMECLSKGYAGYGASYDESSRMTMLSYLDADLNPTLSDNGFARIGITYDASGNIRELSYLDCDGKPVSHKEGYAARVFDFAADGTLTRETCLGTNGLPIACKEGYASEGIEYGTTEEGVNCKIESFFDVDGRPTVNVHGVSKCVREYDKRGNEVKVSYYGTNETLVLSKEGNAGWIASFDDQGNEIARRFWGFEGQLVAIDDGYAGWNKSFNERGQLVRSVMIGADDKPIQGKDGVAEYYYEYYDNGNVKSVSYFGVNGEPTLSIDGIAGWTAEYDFNGNMSAQWFFDTSKKLTLCKDGFAGWQAVYDDRKNKVKEGYFDVDKKLTLTKDGYAWWSAEHDLHGNVVKMSYYDIDGKQVFDNEGVAVYINQYDAYDNLIGQTYIGIDGKPTLDIDGIAGWSAKYDPRGNMTTQWFWGKDGKLTVHRDGCASLTAAYDVWGNKTSEWYFDLEGKPALVKDGYASWRANYDWHGNATTASQFGVDGKLVLDKEGVATCCSEYDELNNQIRCRYYGADQRPITNKFGIAESRNTYNGRGNQTSSRFYGVDGKPTLNEDGVAGWDAEYDAYGHEIRLLNVGLNGAPMMDKYGVVEWKTEFDRFGNITNRTYIGIDGRPTRWRQIVETVDMTVGLPGVKNGIKVGDIWCRFGAYDILRSPNVFLVPQQRALVNREKDLVVARKVADRYEIHAVHFPVGLMGISTDIGKTVDFEKVVSAYREYCNKERERAN